MISWLKIRWPWFALGVIALVSSTIIGASYDRHSPRSGTDEYTLAGTLLAEDLHVTGNATVDGTITQAGAQVVSVAGTALSKAGATLNLNLTTTTCAAGSAEVTTAADGTSTCAVFLNTAGTGLGSSGSTVSLNINGGVAQTCGAGTAVTSMTSAGIQSCSAFINGSSLATFNAGISSTTGPNTFGGTTTFNNGPIGINAYSGTHLEWSDEWLMPVVQPTATLNWPYRDWLCQETGSGNFTANSGTTTRPGILEGGTLTSTTGFATCSFSNALVDFGSGSWTYEWVGGWPTLSTVGGTPQTYASVLGFADNAASSVNATDGCYFLYDQGNVATGGVNPGNANQLEAICVAGGTRTIYLLDGTGTCDGGFTKGTATIAALSLPNTNIYHLKVVMTGNSLASFVFNGTEVCRISTHIPTGASQLTGVFWGILKSAGGTSRTIDVDYTRIAVDLNAARSP